MSDHTAEVVVTLPDDLNGDQDDDLCEAWGRDPQSDNRLVCWRLMGHEGDHFDDERMNWWRFVK